jgi:hypothetical protein
LDNREIGISSSNLNFTQRSLNSNPYRFPYRLSFPLLFFLTSPTSSMGTLPSPSQECHPFTPSNLAHDPVVSPAIDLVVAWRIYGLTMVGREKPQIPCDQLLSEEEWRVLSAWATGQMPDTPPSAQQAIRWIGKVGGWLARGKEDNPGTTCMWRGLVRLANMVQGYMLALQIHSIRDGP